MEYSTNESKNELINTYINEPCIEWYEDDSSDNKYGFLPIPDEATVMGY